MDEAKTYLSGYGETVKHIKLLEQEIKHLQAVKTSLSSHVYDGMPRGRGVRRDLSDYVARLDRLEERLTEEKERLAVQLEELTAKINSFPAAHEEERLILHLRYIRGLDWYEIGEQVGYSRRQVLRIHGAALEDFSKDV